MIKCGISFTFTDNIGTLAGILTRKTVPSLPNKGCLDKKLANRQVVVDLKALDNVDTAGLAWLFLLVEEANALPCQLSYSNVSDDLLKLAKLSGVEQFLPQQSTVF